MAAATKARPRNRSKEARRNARLKRLHRGWLGVPDPPEVPFGAELQRVVLYGLDQVDVTHRMRASDCQMLTSCEQGTQLTLAIADPEGDLQEDGLLDADRDLRTDPIDVRACQAWWRLQSLERTTEGWTLTCEDRAVAWLREYRGRLSSSRARSTRAMFIRRLLRQARVDGYIPQLDDKQRIEPIPLADRTSKSTTTTTAKRAARSSGKPGSTSGMTVKHVRANSAQRRAANEMLEEARRLGASRRAMICVIMCATQESVMGSARGRTGNDDLGYFHQGRDWISVAGANDPARSAKQFLLGERSKRGLKQRNGGSIKNIKGDLNALITRVQGSIGGYGQWEREATRTVDRWLKSSGGTDTGSRAGGIEETTTSKTVIKSYTYERGAKETSWTAARRLADEVEWLLFAVNETVVYASLDELARARPVLTIVRDEQATIEGPSYKLDSRQIAQELTVTLASRRMWELHAGVPVLVEGEGLADGRWVIWQTQRTLNQPQVELTLRRTVPRKLEPAPETSTKTTTTSRRGGRSSRQASATAKGTIKLSGGYVYPLRGTRGKRGGGPAAHKARAFGNWQSDNALDILCPRGTPIVAVADGTVTKLGGAWRGGSGNPDGYNVTITGSGNAWFYTHLRFRTKLRVGQRVKAGDFLGASGAANGVDHLHIGQRDGNPERIFWR